MNMLHHIIWALLNSVWQSGLLALVVVASLRCFGRTTAAQRHAVWCAALVGCALLPATDFALSEGFIHIRAGGPAVALAIPYTTQAPASTVRFDATTSGVEQPAVNFHKHPNSPTHDGASSIAAHGDPYSAPEPSRFEFIQGILGAAFDGRFDGIAFTLWVVLANLLIARLAVGYTHLRKAKAQLQFRDLTELEWETFYRMTERPIAIGYSSTISEPCVIGFRSPVIALPHAIARQLSVDDTMRVIRHECAHISRWDDYSNLFKQLVSALLFFNPIVHLVAQTLDVDREIACDDVAASAAPERVDFAKCLYDIACATERRRWLPVTGLVRGKRQIAVRIAQLLDRNHRGSTRIGSVVKLAASAVIASVIAFACVQIAPSKTLPTASVAPAQTARTSVSARPVSQPRHVTEPRIAQPVATAQQSMPVTMPIVHLSHGHTSTLSQASQTIRVITVSRAALAKTAQLRWTSLPELDARVAIVEARADAAARASDESRVAATVAAASSQFAMAQAQLAQVAATAASRERDDFLQALHDGGFIGLSVGDLIAIHNAGVSPAFLRELHAEKLTPMPVGDLINLASAGVGAKFIAEALKAGYGQLSCAEMVALSDAGVRPAYLAALASEGYHVPIAVVVQLANSGVTPAYIASLAALGYRNLSPAEIIRLNNAGVTAAFIARLNASGVNTSRPFSVDDLIKLANNGV
jgi:beta-lactamase regulating signal transducer with metallopeptidase domain